jgi:uncharacterized protein (DUF362 family)
MGDISRREFVQAGVAGTALSLAASTALAQTASPSKSEVYVGKGKAEETIGKLMQKMGGMGRFVKPGSRVIVKPNMSFANPPDWGTTTSPAAVRAVCLLCIAAGARRIMVCDNTLREPEACKTQSGIADAVADLKSKGVVIFVPKDPSLFESRSDSRAKALTKTDVVKEVLRADALISLPTAKSHSAGGISLGIKGLMGLVKERGPFHAELDLHLAVAEQLYYITPTLTIIDASRALLDNGPSGPGTVKQLDTFVAGTDPVATDSFGVTLAAWYGKQFEGRQVAHIKKAGELGFGNVESSMISQISV